MLINAGKFLLKEQFNMTSSNSKLHDSANSPSFLNVPTGLVYFLAGSGIGAALALLFAPKTGVELRTDISDLTKKGYGETVELAHQLKEQSAGVYQSLKEKTEKVLDLAAAKWSGTKDEVEGALELADQVINGEMTQTNDQSSSKKAIARRSSDII